MTRTILASIMLALTTGGFAAAGAGSGFQAGTWGEAPAYAGDTEEKKATVGNAGQAASLAVDEGKVTPESNVEVREEKTDISEIRGEPSTK